MPVVKNIRSGVKTGFNSSSTNYKLYNFSQVLRSQRTYASSVKWEIPSTYPIGLFQEVIKIIQVKVNKKPSILVIILTLTTMTYKNSRPIRKINPGIK